MGEVKEFETKNLCLFFIISFVYSWFFWLLGKAFPEFAVIPLIGGFSYPLLGWIGNCGPLVAAFGLTYFNERKVGVKKLLKRGIDVSFKRKWLLPTFLLMPIIIVGSFLLAAFLEGLSLNTTLLSNWWEIILPLVVGFILLLTIAPIGEEFGWRGYALDRLQQKWSALTSSVILGIIWGFWHFLNYFPNALPLLLLQFIPFTISTSIVFTWMHNNTGGSVFVALILHTQIDLFANFMPLLVTGETVFAFWFITLFFVVVAVFLVLLTGSKNLVRKKKITEKVEYQFFKD